MIGFSQGWWKTCENAKRLLQHVTCFTFIRKEMGPSSSLDYLWKEELSSLLHQMARHNSTLKQLQLHWNGSTSTTSANCSENNNNSHHSSTNLLSKCIQGLVLSTSSTLQILKLEGIPFMHVFSSGILEEACCPCLHTISFAHSSGFRDRHGQALLSHSTTATSRLPQLAHLDLSFTAVHNLTYTALIHYRKPLQSLNLNGTTLDMPFLRNILTSFSSHLQSLHIQSCPRISDGIELWNLLTSGKNNLQLQSLSMELWFSTQKLLLPLTPNTTPDYDDFQHAQHDNDVIAFLNDQFSELEEDWIWNQDITTWICPYCTLINHYDSSRCAACNGKRTTSTSINNLSAATHNMNDGHNKAGYYKFAKLPFLQLQKLNVIIRVDEDSERIQLEEELDRWRYTCDDESSYHIGTATQSSTTSSPADVIDGTAEIATTLFVQELLSCLPTSTITELCISSMKSAVSITPNIMKGSNTTNNISCYGAKHFTLGIADVSTMVEKLGTTLQKLDMCSVLLSDTDSVYSLLLGLRELRELTLIGVGCMQPSIPEILIALSSTNLREADEQQPASKGYYRCSTSSHCCPHLEKLTLVVHNKNRCSNSTYCPTNRTGMVKNTCGDATVRETLLRALSLEKLWIQGCSSIEEISLDTPMLRWIHLSDCKSLSHISFHDASSTTNMVC